VKKDSVKNMSVMRIAWRNKKRASDIVILIGVASLYVQKEKPLVKPALKKHEKKVQRGMQNENKSFRLFNQQPPLNAYAFIVKPILKHTSRNAMQIQFVVQNVMKRRQRKMQNAPYEEETLNMKNTNI
jgi:hypothetical protein